MRKRLPTRNLITSLQLLRLAFGGLRKCRVHPFLLKIIGTLVSGIVQSYPLLSLRCYTDWEYLPFFRSHRSQRILDSWNSFTALLDAEQGNIFTLPPILFRIHDSTLT
ncbi:hypothetical protein Y032_0465g1954 [Ancylostoma ceylanicum]|uniref:Uncharacterized protein n=1 Tax=Ancylostoma ceylanicum TaxID=53326 RepID=A0A016WYG7_9BILA|nr:hypothetical protein Y032_0465g1954 [Ancylostoma ceylanicum]